MLGVLGGASGQKNTLLWGRNSILLFIIFFIFNGECSVSMVFQGYHSYSARPSLPNFCPPTVAELDRLTHIITHHFLSFLTVRAEYGYRYTPSLSSCDKQCWSSVGEMFVIYSWKNINELIKCPISHTLRSHPGARKLGGDHFIANSRQTFPPLSVQQWPPQVQYFLSSQIMSQCCACITQCHLVTLKGVFLEAWQHYSAESGKLIVMGPAVCFCWDTMQCHEMTCCSHIICVLTNKGNRSRWREEIWGEREPWSY